MKAVTKQSLRAFAGKSLMVWEPKVVGQAVIAPVYLRYRSAVPINDKKHVVPCADGFAHHWYIEEPNGFKALGVCKNCSRVRRFYNTPPRLSLNPWVKRKPKVPVEG
jgi:hypothetical protein